MAVLGKSNNNSHDENTQGPPKQPNQRLHRILPKCKIFTNCYQILHFVPQKRLTAAEKNDLNTKKDTIASY